MVVRALLESLSTFLRITSFSSASSGHFLLSIMPSMILITTITPKKMSIDSIVIIVLKVYIIVGLLLFRYYNLS